jgi:hypothetical protein
MPSVAASGSGELPKVAAHRQLECRAVRNHDAGSRRAGASLGLQRPLTITSTMSRASRALVSHDRDALARLTMRRRRAELQQVSFQSRCRSTRARGSVTSTRTSIERSTHKGTATPGIAFLAVTDEVWLHSLTGSALPCYSRCLPPDVPARQYA